MLLLLFREAALVLLVEGDLAISRNHDLVVLDHELVDLLLVNVLRREIVSAKLSEKGAK